MKEGLSIEGVSNTNKDIIVVYTPSKNVVKYSYKIISNDIILSFNTVDTNEPAEIKFDSTGIYKIEIINYDKYNNSDIITSNEYIIDKDAPKIKLKEKTHTIKANDTFNILDGISALDSKDGDITKNITTNIDDIDFSKEGIKTINYTVFDSAGNKSEEVMYITVKKDNTDLIRLGQVSIILFIAIVITFLIKYIRSIKLERRFSKYTINSSKNKSISLFDFLSSRYENLLNKFNVIISKSTFLNNVSKKYDKYVDSLNIESSMKFISKKIFLGIIYLIIVVVIKLLKSSILQPYEMIIPFVIGYYALDLVYIIRYSSYKKKLENDMLKAITVMNNAFKSGRSIIQAIDLVSKELDGPIAKEFKKIYMEINLGLDIEVAFSRFSDRIKVDEAVYLTSSLSVLNKTGGNIIKVFDSIEKNLYSKRKLKVELKSLTASSKLIMYVLILIPLAFAIFVNILNTNYFAPLFSNPLGLMIIGLMVIIYVAYIIVVTKVMKVRM